MKLAERLLLAVEAIPCPGENFQLSVSIGLAERSHGESIEDLLHRADAALYRAKDVGPDRVISAGVDR